MVRHDLELPVIQNWSCHNCGGCCRQHQIEITEEERRRIEQQNWQNAPEIPADQPLFQTLGPWWNRRSALAHQADGACVFLDERGLCRIHAKFGEAAKPLACRVYPYAFHPAGKKVAVSLRFSCPSVVGNLGKPLTEKTGELKKLAAAVVPDYARELSPPRVNDHEQVPWPEFLRFVSALDDTLANPEATMAVNLCQALGWLKLVGTARFEKLQGPRLTEFLELISAASAAEMQETVASNAAPREPSRAGRLQFRTLVAQYARKDTAADLSTGWRGRWRLFKAALRFAKGTGTIPPLQSAFGEVSFDTVEQFSRAVPAEAEELFTRYFRVKVQGLHCCGRAYYDVPLVEGFQSLALMYPVVLWLARWLAASNQREQLTREDVSLALAIADHHHGYSPALGTRNARRRVRLLASNNDVSKLCRWYGAS